MAFSYKSQRSRCWRNLMVAALNAGLAQGIFGVRPGENYWGGERALFRFAFEGVPCIASVQDARFDELAVRVTAWPEAGAEKHVHAGSHGLWHCEARAEGWLERRNGAWLQTGRRQLFWAKRDRRQVLATWNVTARGFADRGTFYL